MEDGSEPIIKSYLLIFNKERCLYQYLKNPKALDPLVWNGILVDAQRGSLLAGVPLPG